MTRSNQNHWSTFPTATNDPISKRVVPLTDFAAAECAIRQLQASYVDAVFRFDFEAFANCFAEDCEWRIDGTVMRGRDEIVELNRQMMMTRFRRLLITLRTPVLDVQDGSASGRTYFSAQNILADGTGFAPLGVYYERFVDEGDQWRFKWRLFETYYSGPPAMSGQWHDQPDYGPPPNMPPMDAATAMVVGKHREAEQSLRK